MKTKIPTRLNLPTDKKVQFDDVSFVEGMSEYSLKVLVKRIWGQLMALANVSETRRKDIPSILDKILNSQTWSAKDLDDRYQYGIHRNFIVKYDTLKRTFTFLDDAKEPIGDPINAVSLSETKKYFREQRSK